MRKRYKYDKYNQSLNISNDKNSEERNIMPELNLIKQ